MQSLWDRVDQYIEQVVDQDPRLIQSAAYSSAQGLPEHLAVSANHGMLLQMLLKMNQCQRVLEIGTFAGYSTLWLARALDEHGYLLTIEAREAHAEVAAENFKQANMPVCIDLKVGMAAPILQQLIDEKVAPFDFIFVDADKQSYPDYLNFAIELSHSGSVIVFDNVVRSGDIVDLEVQKPSVVGVRELYQKMQQHPCLSMVTAIQTVGRKGHDGFAIATVK